MAFNYDTADPATTSPIANFPTNEQAFRTTVANAVGVVVDPTSQLGPIIQKYTTTQKTALVSPPTGLMVYDTTLAALQMNLGTPASPTWTSV